MIRIDLEISSYEISDGVVNKIGEICKLFTQGGFVRLKRADKYLILESPCITGKLYLSMEELHEALRIIEAASPRCQYREG